MGDRGDRTRNSDRDRGSRCWLQVLGSVFSGNQGSRTNNEPGTRQFDKCSVHAYYNDHEDNFSGGCKSTIFQCPEGGCQGGDLHGSLKGADGGIHCPILRG